MEVIQPGDRRHPWRRAIVTAGAGTAVAGTLALPALSFAWYGRAVATALVLAALGGAGRLLVGAVPALLRRPRDPPSVDDLPTASVIVTAYDEADVLPATVAACLDLAYPADALEVVVCYEAASTDGTAAIAERAAGPAGDRAPRVVAVQRDRPPGGKGAAVNVGLERATGEVVAVIDADQVLEPDALRRAAAWLRGADADCVTGRRVGRNPRASLVALHATVEHHLAERVEFVARDVLGGFELFTGGQAFFDAAVLDELGPFDEDVLLEDVEMACRLHADGRSVVVDPAIRSTEVNPTSVRAWWRQRVRWARGGMQVGRRHLPALLAGPAPSAGRRVDAALTFGGLFAVPVLLLVSPAALVASLDVVATGAAIAAPVPGAGPVVRSRWPVAVAAAVVGVPLAVATTVLLLDRHDGRAHTRAMYLVPLTLWLYALLQALAVAAAFLDEFVLSRPTVYETS